MQQTTNTATAMPTTTVRLDCHRHMSVCAFTWWNHVRKSEPQNRRETGRDILHALRGFRIVERHRLERIDGRNVLWTRHTRVKRNLHRLRLCELALDIGRNR